MHVQVHERVGHTGAGLPGDRSEPGPHGRCLAMHELTIAPGEGGPDDFVREPTSSNRRSGSVARCRRGAVHGVHQRVEHRDSRRRSGSIAAASSSPRGARRTWCPGSAASPASGAAARPAPAGRGGAVRCASGQRAVRRGQLAGGEREPRDEADASPVAVRRAASSASRLARLYRFCTRDDLGDLLRGLELLDDDLGQTDVPDLALAPAARRARPSWSASGTSGSMRCSWKRSMRSTPSRRRRQLDLLAQVGRAADRGPLARTRAGQPGLGRDHERRRRTGAAPRAISSSVTYGP